MNKDIEPTVSLEQLAASSLDLPAEWSVESLQWEVPLKTLRIRLSPSRKARWRCSTCNQEAPVYDLLKKSWRHLDLWSFETWVHAAIPRTNCPRHGVLATPVSWADPRSRLTRPVTERAIALLRNHRVGTAAAVLGLKWDQLKRLKNRIES